MMNLALGESVGAFAVPALFAPDAAAKRRTVEFFTAHIRNANTRKAYASAGKDFARWCRGHGICDLCSVQPVHVATYIEVRLHEKAVSHQALHRRRTCGSAERVRCQRRATGAT